MPRTLIRAHTLAEARQAFLGDPQNRTRVIDDASWDRRYPRDRYGRRLYEVLWHYRRRRW